MPDYFFDPRFYGVTAPEGGYEDFDFPIHNYHAADDAIATPVNIRNFWKHVKSSGGITFESIRPESAGLQKVDHFGYFKSAMKNTLWKDVASRLERMLPQCVDGALSATGS